MFAIAIDSGYDEHENLTGATYAHARFILQAHAYALALSVDRLQFTQWHGRTIAATHRLDSEP